MEFYNKFQRKMEEHDRDFEGKWNEDMNTTLIFVSGIRVVLGRGSRIAYCGVSRSLVCSLR